MTKQTKPVDRVIPIKLSLERKTQNDRKSDRELIDETLTLLELLALIKRDGSTKGKNERDVAHAFFEYAATICCLKLWENSDALSPQKVLKSDPIDAKAKFKKAQKNLCKALEKMRLHTTASLHSSGDKDPFRLILECHNAVLEDADKLVELGLGFLTRAMFLESLTRKKGRPDKDDEARVLDEACKLGITLDDLAKAAKERDSLLCSKRTSPDQLKERWRVLLTRRKNTVLK